MLLRKGNKIVRAESTNKVNEGHEEVSVQDIESALSGSVFVGDKEYDIKAKCIDAELPEFTNIDVFVNGRRRNDLAYCVRDFSEDSPVRCIVGCYEDDLAEEDTPLHRDLVNLIKAGELFRNDVLNRLGIDIRENRKPIRRRLIQR